MEVSLIISAVHVFEQIKRKSFFLIFKYYELGLEQAKLKHL